MCVVNLQGWEKLTDAVIRWINDHLNGVVFLLWGSYAQKKGSSIDKVSVYMPLMIKGSHDILCHRKDTMS